MELQNTKGIKIVYANKENEIPTEEQIIKSITSKTKVISFANISNLLGYELDISKIEKLAHKKNKNVIIVVDATQAIPHKKLDVTKSNIDFMVCSGHKMLSGTGIGCVYMKDKYLSSLKPLRLGGGMNNQVSCNKFTYAPSPDKFEGGSPHTAGIIS
jgi:cysteine desulfurase/selenocysteine lyase